MINVGPSYEYTFNVGDNNVSSSSHSVYYIYSYNDMEDVITYTFTQGKVIKGKTSREKGTKDKTEKKED